jgi:predicted nucleic acid-binding protein
MSRFVLDCSMAIAWCFDDEGPPRAEAVLASLAVNEALVPNVWPLEVANVLAVCERRGRLTAADVAAVLAMLGQSPISIDEKTAEHALGTTLSLARSHRLTAYDAAYLELALRTGSPLASLDSELNATAAGLGIALFDG